MRYDAVIVGGGIVGLATALKLSEKRPSLKFAVLEKESDVARHQSGHNSGVIHSGIYYRPGSLKAKNCILGRRLLLEFCDEQNIKYELCGKIIIASTEDEQQRLDQLFSIGLANGLAGIKQISGDEIKEYEPHAEGLAGLFVPQTGMVNFGEVAAAYAKLFAANGGQIHLNQKVTGIRRQSSFSQIQTPDKTYEARLVINCAGLYADSIARFNRPSLEARIIPFRGEYYKLREHRRRLIKNLIYPLPNPAFPFLGVHFTRRINGDVEAGPNAVFAFRREGYRRFNFNLREFTQSILWPGFGKMAFRNWKTGAGEFYRSFFKTAFVRELKKLVPDIAENDLVPAGAGVRAQAVGRDGQLIDDFLILEDPFQIDVINAPSPAATASLAIGQAIAEKALTRF